jgi:hypothetical protein
MKQVKLFGLSLAAVFALAAAASSSASAACNGSALPCFHGPYPIHFTALQLGVGTLKTVAGRTVECQHGSALGFVQSAKDVLVNGITYKTCKSTGFGGEACQSAGAASGEIVTLPLLGLLGYITKVPPLVGILFEPHGSINHFASFECSAFGFKEKLTVKGTLICDLTSAAPNMSTDKYHLNCKQTNGMSEPLTFEGLGTKDHLTTEGAGAEPFAAEESGVTALSDVLTLTPTILLA